MTNKTHTPKKSPNTLGASELNRTNVQKAEDVIAHYWGDRLEGFTYMRTHMLAWYVTPEGRDDAAIFTLTEIEDMAANKWTPEMVQA